MVHGRCAQGRATPGYRLSAVHIALLASKLCLAPLEALYSGRLTTTPFAALRDVPPLLQTLRGSYRVAGKQVVPCSLGSTMFWQVDYHALRYAQGRATPGYRLWGRNSRLMNNPG